MGIAALINPASRDNQNLQQSKPSTVRAIFSKVTPFVASSDSLRILQEASGRLEKILPKKASLELTKENIQAGRKESAQHARASTVVKEDIELKEAPKPGP